MGTPAGSGYFGIAPAAQRDTGLCLPNRWHHRSQCRRSRFWGQRSTCCPPASLLGTGAGSCAPVLLRSAQEGCLQNASCKGSLCSRQLWGSGTGISGNNSSPALCVALCLGNAVYHGAADPPFGVCLGFFFCAPSSGSPAGRSERDKSQTSCGVGGEMLAGEPLGGRDWELRAPGLGQEAIRQAGKGGTSWQGTASGGDEAGAGGRAGACSRLGGCGE